MQPNKRIINILKNYKERLKNEKFSIDNLYLFGSYANGNQDISSDIDVCVVTKEINNKNYLEKKKLLWKMTRGIDSRIEPVAYNPKNFTLADPLAYEIIQNGIEI